MTIPRRLIRTRKDKPYAVKSRFYRRSLLLVLLVTCIPTLLIGVGSHQIGVRQVQRELTHTHLIQLRQASDKVDEFISQMQMMTNQWANHSMFAETLADMRFEEHFLFTHELYRTLMIMNNFNPQISGTRLLLFDKRVLISPDGIVALSGGEAEFYRKLRTHPQSIFIAYNAHPDEGGESEQTVSLVHKLPPGKKEAFGAFILDLNMREISDVLKPINPAGQGIAFILRQDGSRLAALPPEGAGGDEAESGFGPAEERLRRSVLERPESSGSFVFTAGAKDYAVAYGRFSPFGWIYVSALPLAELTGPVTFVSRTMLTLNLAGLAVAALLSWAASRQIYHPIRRLTQLFRSQSARADESEPGDELEFIRSEWEYVTRESDTLQSKWAQHLPLLRESFLIQFVSGHMPSLTEDELRDKYERLGKDVSERQFGFVLFHLSGLFTAARFFEGDEQLISFAAANIIGDLLEERQAEVLNFQDLTVGVLLLYPQDWPPEAVKADSEAFSGQALRTLHDILKIKAAAVLTRPARRMKDIPRLLDSCRQTILYRDTTQNIQLLEAETMPDQAGKPFYPFSLEKEIVQQLRIGDVRQAAAAIERFIAELQAFDSRDIFVRQGLLQLLGSLRHALIRGGFPDAGLYAETNLYDQFMQIEELSRAADWFEERILAPYAEFVFESDKSREEEVLLLIERVSETVRSAYDRPISLESVADQFGVMPYLLSKWFKKIKGINFIDYLTAIRLERAKELLAGTNMKINDIAEQVGYQPSYFNRTFKKNEGMTPKAYRELKGKNGGAPGGAE